MTMKITTNVGKVAITMTASEFWLAKKVVP
jgi:hypothetical protein